MKGCLVPVAILLAIAVFGLVLSNDEEPNELYTTACIDNKTQMNAIVASWTASGVIREFVGSNIEVNEHLWGTLSRRERISILVAAYCRTADPNGDGLTKAVSSRTGDDVRGYIINGNYFD